MRLFLGLDIGTTAVKAALFTDQGRLLSRSVQEYTLLTPGPSLVELPAPVYWQACCRAVAAAVTESGRTGKDIYAMAISCQGETILPLDASGEPLSNAIIWLDNRSTTEAAAIADYFGIEQVCHMTGQPEIAATWPACKYLWIRRHSPEVFSKTAHFALLEDYLLLKLTGEIAGEYSLYSSSLLLDITNKRWWDSMLDYLNISQDKLPALVSSGTIVGKLRFEAANELGLSPGIPVVSGALDQVAGAVGAGNVTPGILTEMTGSVLAIVTTLSKPFLKAEYRVPCHCHALPDTYCLLPWNQTAGLALRWFRDQFCADELKKALANGRDAYDILMESARTIEAGADGLLFLPHLEGAAFPEFNPAARAVFFGATLQHTKAHFLRAIIEAVAYMLKRDVDVISSLGVNVDIILSMGGAARSQLWRQIKANVLQRPVFLVAGEEVGCLGAAIMAAVGSGFYRNIPEACASMVHLDECVSPEPEKLAVYEEGYRRYLELYQRLEPMFS